MNSLTILALLIAVSVAFFTSCSLINQIRNTRANMEWFNQHRIRVQATVTHVQIGQDWQDEEGCHRDPWDGFLKQNKTWQTYHVITAQWMDRQTQQVFTFRSKAWPNDLTKKPVAGDTLEILVDPSNPRRYIMDFH